MTSRYSHLTINHDKSIESIAMEKKLIIAGTAEFIPAAVEQIYDFCCHAGFGSDECFRIQVLLAEVLNNIVEHALTELPGDPIQIVCRIDEHNLILTTIDFGKPFNVDAAQAMPHCHAESGRGWPIIFEWADKITQTRNENSNHLNITISRDMSDANLAY